VDREQQTEAAQKKDREGILGLVHVMDAVHRVERKVDQLMASTEELETLATTLKTDFEALAANAQAEFKKLEEEVAAGAPVNLDPLKASIEAIDTSVKAVVIPTA